MRILSDVLPHVFTCSQRAASNFIFSPWPYCTARQKSRNNISSSERRDMTDEKQWFHLNDFYSEGQLANDAQCLSNKGHSQDSPGINRALIEVNSGTNEAFTQIHVGTNKRSHTTWLRTNVT